MNDFAMQVRATSKDALWERLAHAEELKFFLNECGCKHSCFGKSLSWRPLCFSVTACPLL